MIDAIQATDLTTYWQMGLNLALIFLVGAGLYVAGKRGLDTLQQRRVLSPSMRNMVGLVLRWALLILIGLLVLQQFGIRLTSVWAALSAVIVLVGVGFVAVWSVISNILCSLLLLLFRPFQVGDEVEVSNAGLRGKVVNVNLMFTFLEETNDTGLTGAFVHVPNNLFFQNSIRRWPGSKAERLEDYMFKKYDHEHQPAEGATA